MVVHDHDSIIGGPLEQTQSLRAPSFEASAEARETNGAQNRSPSRKRQRLDNSSRTSRSESADRTLSSLDKAVAEMRSDGAVMEVDNSPATPDAGDTSPIVPAATPSRVTINVREMVKEGAATTANGRHEFDTSPRPMKSTKSINGHVESGKISAESNVHSRSPTPTIEVTDVHADQNDEAIIEISLDADDQVTLEDQIKAHFFIFPYSADGGYEEAAELIAQDQAKGECP
jgi:hypothetical protein